MHDDDRVTTLVRVTREIRTVVAAAEMAAVVTRQALSAVPDAEWASLTLRRTTRRRTVYETAAWTDGIALSIDVLQYELDEGPCLDTARGQDWRRSGDVDLDARWPRWGPRAAAVGVGSVLSIALVGKNRPLGALNLYSRSSGAFAERDLVDAALLYGAHVGVVLGLSQEVSGLTVAMESRHVIGTAQGILMERFGLSVDAAFDLLKRYSSVLNIRIADLAQQVVRTRELPELTDVHLGAADARDGTDRDDP